MPSTQKTPFINLNQWEPSDKLCMDDFNNDNLKIDSHIQKISDNLSSHNENKKIHVNNETLESINNHISDKKIHTTEDQLSDVNKSLTAHISNASLHTIPENLKDMSSQLKTHIKDKSSHISKDKLEQIKIPLNIHLQDKNIHIDPGKMSTIDAHMKDSKSHVDPVLISQLKSHSDNKNIHFNESTLIKLNEHLSNKDIHFDPSHISNPFYYVGSYVGNGNEQQLITLPFSPSFVIVFAQNKAPAFVTAKSQESTVTFGCCSKSCGSLGLIPSPQGFIAQTVSTYQLNKIVKQLNVAGITYQYIAFK